MMFMAMMVTVIRVARSNPPENTDVQYDGDTLMLASFEAGPIHAF